MIEQGVCHIAKHGSYQYQGWANQGVKTRITQLEGFPRAPYSSDPAEVEACKILGSEKEDGQPESVFSLSGELAGSEQSRS